MLKKIIKVLETKYKTIDLNRPMSWKDLINVLKSIPDENGMTIHQEEKIEELKEKGYEWDKRHSIAAAGVVMTKWKYGGVEDMWFFGLNGEIMHNP